VKWGTLEPLYYRNDFLEGCNRFTCWGWWSSPCQGIGGMFGTRKDGPEAGTLAILFC
jgi:hypothetical protein